LNLRLKGSAAKEKTRLSLSASYALSPADFVGLVPKVVVREGDCVKAGDALFVDKTCPETRFASPVSGTVEAIERGERRKVLRVKVKADAEQQYADFGKCNVNDLSGDEVEGPTDSKLGSSDTSTSLPYAVVTQPTTAPKAIFVSALRDMPLAADFEFELQGNEADFQTGLTALSKMAPTYLGIGALANGIGTHRGQGCRNQCLRWSLPRRQRRRAGESCLARQQRRNRVDR